MKELDMLDFTLPPGENPAAQLRKHIQDCFVALAELEGSQDYYDRAWLASEALA